MNQRWNCCWQNEGYSSWTFKVTSLDLCFSIIQLELEWKRQKPKRIQTNIYNAKKSVYQRLPISLYLQKLDFWLTLWSGQLSSNKFCNVRQIIIIVTSESSLSSMVRLNLFNIQQWCYFTHFVKGIEHSLVFVMELVLWIMMWELMYLNRFMKFNKFTFCDIKYQSVWFTVLLFVSLNDLDQAKSV